MGGGGGLRGEAICGRIWIFFGLTQAILNSYYSRENASEIPAVSVGIPILF